MKFKVKFKNIAIYSIKYCVQLTSNATLKNTVQVSVANRNKYNDQKIFLQNQQKIGEKPDGYPMVLVKIGPR